MLTAKYVRDHLEEIKKSLEKRKSDFPLDTLLKYDEEVRRLGRKLQDLRAERNKLSLEISEEKKQGKEPSKELLEKVSEVKKQIEQQEPLVEQYESKLNELLWTMPNILHESVPYGKDENDNVE
jgi:Seryl-tRNA synthetase